MSLLAVVLLAACGGTGLAEPAAEELQQHTAAVRAAAEAGDPGAAQVALARLRASLDEHTEAGAIGPRRADDIAAAAELVAARLPLLVPEAPVDDPPPAQPPRPNAPADDDGDDGDDDKDEDERGEQPDGNKRDQKDDGEGEGDGDRTSDSGATSGRGPDGEGPPGQRRRDR